MLLEILYSLLESSKILPIFSNIFFRSISAGLLSFCCTLLLMPSFIRKMQNLKFGQEVRADGPSSHYKKAGVPTMGGMLICFSVTASSLLFFRLESSKMWLFLLSMLLYASLGFWDDYLKIMRKNSAGLKGRAKLIGQITIGLLIAICIYWSRDTQTALVSIPFFQNAVINLEFFYGIFYIFFVILLMTSASNAVNLSDGLDGLATGLTVIALLPFALISYISVNSEYSAYLNINIISGASELSIGILSLIGASLGFLRYNSYPAKIFMGDTGSMALGAALGILSLLLKKEILLLVIGGVFVIETLSVILQVTYYRYTGGQRLFLMAPIHHHFELKGFKETKVVTGFWILGTVFAMLGMIIL